MTIITSTRHNHKLFDNFKAIILAHLQNISIFANKIYNIKHHELLNKT